MSYELIKMYELLHTTLILQCGTSPIQFILSFSRVGSVLGLLSHNLGIILHQDISF